MCSQYTFQSVGFFIPLGSYTLILMFVNFRLFFKHCRKIFCFYSWHFQYQTANLQTLQSHSFEAPLRFSRLETPSSKVSRIENRVSSLEDIWDATDCQLTFERYCRMPEQGSGVQFLNNYWMRFLWYAE